MMNYYLSKLNIYLYTQTLIGIVLGQSINFKEILIFSLSKSSDIIALLISSLLIRIILDISGEKWIKTFSQTNTIFILPIITYIITSVISGNIALSLGMVGALSIVRFRNPVRSPFQLSVYFAVITIGIATSVNIKWLFLILFVIIILILFFKLFTISYKSILKESPFTASFSEGNNNCTLEVSSQSKINSLDESDLLKSITCENKIYSYLLVSSNFKKLKSKLKEIENDKNIISYQLNE